MPDKDIYLYCNMNIRKADVSDLDQLSQLFDSYRVWYRKESDLTGSKEFLKNRLSNNESVIFVLEEGGALIGFTQLYPLFSSTRLRRMWLLNDLFIKKAHRNLGLGKSLIDSAKDFCRNSGACGILLETESNNEPGNHLYCKEGFHLEENNFYFWTADE